ncbi:MAG TPA: CHAD domain-containing protein [Gemmatales bacterium]|nr:CHAD domain-containing protein [Gemmatales bacterium]HMP15600.1 CHAD domain-containing protein [Gemmatales bacterium]
MQSLLAQALRLRDLLQAWISASSYDPKITHEIRKLTRKCRANSRALHRLGIIPVEPYQQFWRNIRHCLCGLRDADIKIESFFAFFPGLENASSQILGQLEEHWLLQYSEARSRLIRLLARHPDWLHQLEADCQKQNNHVWGKSQQRWLNKQIARWHNALHQDLTDADQLHAFRIATKKLRYLLQSLKPALEESFELLPTLEKIQQLLGQERDLTCVIQTIERARTLVNLRPSTSKGMSSDLQEWLNWCTHGLQKIQTEIRLLFAGTIEGVHLDSEAK